MVCANCGSESHHTGSSTCQSYCTMCAQPGHRQQRGSCPYRVCNTCGETGHSARECDPRCKACGSSDHRNSSNFACPEHKCSKCKGALDPKGHNKNNCPQILSTICTLCEEVGHDEERCPTRPCPACGNRTHKSPMHFECPEHKCATCGEKGHNRTNCPTTQCETCGLFGHLPNDCPFVNCVDVPIDWLNILMSTKSTDTVIAYFEDVSLAPTSLRIDGLIKPFTDWDHLRRACILYYPTFACT